MVKVSSQQGDPLEYIQLEKATKELSARELQQFIDYTGSEYDMEEDTFAKDHRVYQKMIASLCNGTGKSMKDILSCPYEVRSRLGRNQQWETRASRKEVAKLLRL
jgi:hypothetical protein